MKDEIVIKPIKIQEYTCKQSKHDIVPKLPLRGILLSPSGGIILLYIVNVLNADSCLVHRCMLIKHGKL